MKDLIDTQKKSSKSPSSLDRYKKMHAVFTLTQVLMLIVLFAATPLGYQSGISHTLIYGLCIAVIMFARSRLGGFICPTCKNKVLAGKVKYCPSCGAVDSIEKNGLLSEAQCERCDTLLWRVKDGLLYRVNYCTCCGAHLSCDKKQ